MEYLDLYDENKNLIGKKVLRTKDIKIEPGEYINIVIVFIQNSEGKFLIQKTSKEKGSIWATTGGHVKAGNTCDKTILDEIKEELGISVEFNEIKHIQTNKINSVFQDVYYLKKELDINKLDLQKEEVECVKWLTIEDINELIEKDQFRKSNINAFKYLIEKGDL